MQLWDDPRLNALRAFSTILLRVSAVGTPTIG